MKNYLPLNVRSVDIEKPKQLLSWDLSKLKIFLAPFDLFYQKTLSANALTQLSDYRLFFEKLSRKTGLEFVDGLSFLDQLLDSYDALNLKYGTEKADAFFLYCQEQVREADIVFCFYPNSYTLINSFADKYGKSIHYYVPIGVDIDEALKSFLIYPMFSSFFNLIYDSSFESFLFNAVDNFMRLNNVSRK